MFRIACLVASLTLYTCSGAKQTTTAAAAETTTEIQTISAKEMKEKGFSKGTLTSSKSKDCPYILTIEEYKDKLDPINLGDFFKGDDMPAQVWVKFSNLRMASRCNDARPVSITAIDKRIENK
ncbi:hypothetical protein U6A24_18665 [Aquimarina gracilis]|uniref:Uncharacterized protein n=2 Tax=Aquimarina gracilis TaxID=874422 RepID=A0ABU6A0C4_9FLAO|nr:hypothetical protein [Aquimarina gracilis]